jgi:hypothetical protein
MAGFAFGGRMDIDETKIEALRWAVSLAERGESASVTIERANGYVTFLSPEPHLNHLKVNLPKDLSNPLKCFRLTLGGIGRLPRLVRGSDFLA